MKTSLFDMTFVLPPVVEMVKEEKEMPWASKKWANRSAKWWVVGCC